MEDLWKQVQDLWDSLCQHVGPIAGSIGGLVVVGLVVLLLMDR